jgi:hypothetical protein
MEDLLSRGLTCVPAGTSASSFPGMCLPSTLAFPQIERPLECDHLDRNSDKMSAILGLPLRWEEHVTTNGAQETVCVASSLIDVQTVRVNQYNFGTGVQTLPNCEKILLLRRRYNKGVDLLRAMGDCISADHREPT